MDIQDLRNKRFHIVVDGVEYESPTDASRATGLRRATLCRSFWHGQQYCCSHEIRHPDPEIEKQRLALYPYAREKKYKQRAVFPEDKPKSIPHGDILYDGKVYSNVYHDICKGMTRHDVNRITFEFACGNTEIDGKPIRFVCDEKEAIRQAYGPKYIAKAGTDEYHEYARMKLKKHRKG